MKKILATGQWPSFYFTLQTNLVLLCFTNWNDSKQRLLFESAAEEYWYRVCSHQPFKVRLNPTLECYLLCCSLPWCCECRWRLTTAWGTPKKMGNAQVWGASREKRSMLVALSTLPECRLLSPKLCTCPKCCSQLYVLHTVDADLRPWLDWLISLSLELGFHL